jgi:ABC-type lipoprotein release transport system permease subunit
VSESPWPRIGWRNLGRHRKRTVLTALGLAVGYFACVFLVGWTAGIQSQMVENATSLVSGQIEINDAEYRPDRSLYDTIGGRDGADVGALLRAIDADEAVVAAAPRVYSGGLLSSGESTTAGSLLGVDPERERALTRYLDELVEGELPVAGRNELLIGEEMARQLEVGIGDELVLVGSGADGSMANDLFTVAGIFRTGLLEFDASTAVMPIEDLQALIVLDPRRIHEIVVATVDPWVATATAARLAGVLDATARPLAVMSWTELNPAMVEYIALGESFYWVILLIVFSIALFGVANTMLMATFERRREFAVMLALGSTPLSIVKIVLFEALAIGVLSLALAAVFTFPLMVWWHTAPPSLSLFFEDVTLMGALLVPDLRVEYNVPVWIWTAAALIATALLAALYPAALAARIPPADTLSGL